MSRLGDVRPTTAKVRESLLATLQDYWPEARVLDLFAGSGSLGAAAIAAGAAEVVFVEGHARVARALRFPPPHRVVQGQLPAALHKLQGQFDVVLADPPYGASEGPLCLAALEPYLAGQAWVVFEHHHKESYPEQTGELQLWRRKRFGETALSYYRKRSDHGEGAAPAGGQAEISGQPGAATGAT